jgi:hypothetical protein
MTDYSPSLDALADALGLLDTAESYNYDLGASYQAALNRLGGLDADQARQAAAAVAALVARWTLLVSFAPGTRQVLPLDMWVRYARCALAERREEP